MKTRTLIRTISLLVIACSLWIIFTVKNYHTMSVAELEKYANKNDPKAQLTLGYRYYMGQEVSQDYQKAMELYLKSAALGNARAMYNIGILYIEGSGVKKDIDKVIEWNERSLKAEPTNVAAMNNLAWAYAHNQNYTKAMELYTKAAEKGHLGAQTGVAWLYRRSEEHT
ncbi:MAG TPA: hypothetical protein DD638_07925, partial [Pasteurellaceae bacterium]|nr:hypothetical protein [Pasteurellaceae bacterium]